MKNKLVIHIGTPKTGTTAIQQFLYLNSAMLEKCGWSYLDLQRGADLKSNMDFVHGTAVKTLGKAVDPATGWRVDTGHAIWQEMWTRIKELLKEKNVILSEEMIWRWNLTSFFGESKKEYDAIDAVIYLRRQDRYIESWWNQEVKERPYRTESFVAYIENGKDASLQYLKKLDEIAEVIGAEHLKVRIYEKGQFLGAKKDVVSDFLAALGIFPDWEDCVLLPPENEGLSGNYLEIKRNLNVVLAKEDMAAKQMQLAFRDIYARQKKRDHIRHMEGYFSPEERKRFLECFADENSEIAEKYLGREKLFSEEETDIPEYRADGAMLYADMIRVFGEFIYQQQKKISVQAKLTLGMFQKFLSMDGRKLALFGAGIGCRNVLKECSLPVEVIWDNDIRMHGKYMQGIPIAALEKENIRDYFVMITCERESLIIQIEEQLEKLGCQKYDDYIAAKDLL